MAEAKIAAHYLLSAPPGELKEVETDVLTLGRGVLTPDALTSVKATYCASSAAPFLLTGGGGGGTPVTAVVATKELQVTPTVYVDSVSRRLVRVDMSTFTASPVTEDTVVVDGEERPVSLIVASMLPDSREEVRRDLCTALCDHVGKGYNATATGTWPWAKGVQVFPDLAAAAGGEHVYCIVTSVVVRNLSNFWTGGMVGRYTVHAAPGAEWTVRGGLRMTTHYFESGNTQMHQERALGGGGGVKVKAAAAAVLSAVAAFEDETHLKLDEMFEAISVTALKEMRRFLPVSGQKMNWNAAEHRMRKTLASGK